MFHYTEEDLNPRTQSWKDDGPSELSRFDEELRMRWDRALSLGVMRYGVDHLITKVLDGPKHYVVTLNTKRNSKRRRPQEITSMDQPFNNQSFNFTKAKPEEILLTMKKCPSSDAGQSVNTQCPLTSGHSNNRQCQNQCPLRMSQCCHQEECPPMTGHTNDHCPCTAGRINNIHSPCLTGHTNIHESFVIDHTKNNQCPHPSDHPPCDCQPRIPYPCIHNGLGRNSHVDGRSNDVTPDPGIELGDFTLMTNVSPMEYGHTVLAPDRNACHNQSMTQPAITAAIETMLLSKHRGLIMGFNSLCANASVNHLHLNFFYLEYELIASHCDVRHLSGQVHETTDLPCNGFVLQLHQSSVDAMASLAFKIFRCLLENEVPHNALLCRGVAFGEERFSENTTLRLFIWPRKKYFIGSEESVIFFVACYEFGGYLPVFETEIFDELTEAQSDATLAALKFPDDEYQRIKDKVIQMLEKDERSS